MSRRTPLRLALLLAFAAAAFPACGGGGDDDGLGTPIARFESGVWMGPQIGVVTASSAVVRWDTVGRHPCSVLYGPLDAPESLEATSPVGTTHEVALADLEPATRYAYRLVIRGSRSPRTHIFRTVSADVQAPLRIVVLGDVGCGCQAELSAVPQIQSLDPDLVLFTGDLAYPAAAPDAFRSRFMVPFADVMDRIPIYAAIGNHDVDHDDASAVFSALALPTNDVDDSEQFYEHRIGNVQLVALNGEWGVDASDTPQVTWLDGVLQTEGPTWRIVFDHKPPYTWGNHEPNQDLIANVVPVLEARGVDLFVSGHDHNYQRTLPLVGGQPTTFEASTLVDPVGITYIVSGGGGRGLHKIEEPGPELAAYEVAFHLTVIDIEGATATIRSLRRDGSTIDAFTITKTEGGSAR